MARSSWKFLSLSRLFFRKLVYNKVVQSITLAETGTLANFVIVKRRDVVFKGCFAYNFLLARRKQMYKYLGGATTRYRCTRFFLTRWNAFMHFGELFPTRMLNTFRGKVDQKKRDKLLRDMRKAANKGKHVRGQTRRLKAKVRKAVNRKRKKTIKKKRKFSW